MVVQAILYSSAQREHYKSIIRPTTFIIVAINTKVSSVSVIILHSLCFVISHKSILGLAFFHGHLLNLRLYIEQESLFRLEYHLDVYADGWTVI